jgi:hypothetical protein
MLHSVAQPSFLSSLHTLLRVWGTYKLRSEGRRAIERMRKFGRREPPEPELAVKPGLPLQDGTEVQEVHNLGPPLEPELTVEPGLPLQDRTTVQELRNFGPPLEPELAAKPGLPLQVGTKVRAVRNFGPVKEGAPGIITGVADIPFFWWSRPAYLCTFADNRKVHTRPKTIEEVDHGHNLEELVQPDFGSILSRHMTLQAQQLLSRQRPTRPPFAGKANAPNGSS